MTKKAFNSSKTSMSGMVHRARFIALTVGAFVTLAVVASSVHAATFMEVEGEGNPDCVLDFGGPDRLSIRGRKGDGFTARVYLQFGLLDAFPPTKELRLELRTNPDRRTDVLIGNVSELDMLPIFITSPSLLRLMAWVPEFTYTLEGRPPVRLPGPTSDEVTSFTDCVMSP